MNALSIVAILLAIATTVITWVDFSGDEASETSAVSALLNEGDVTLAPDDVKSIRVAKWNDQEKAPQVFEVAFKDGQWLIPSRYDYPADGGERVGETSGKVMNIKRGPLVSADAKMHAELGVLDPMTSDGEEGHGQQVTLKGEGGKLLVDIIVGKRSSASNVYYVRNAHSDEVYTADISVDVSTAFSDWVETDLLKVEVGSVKALNVYDYSLTDKGPEMRAQTEFTRVNSAEPWLSKQTPKKKIVSKEKVDALVSEATGLTLVDIRPYDQRLLRSAGFHVSEQGISSEEGTLILGTESGVLYYLFFGEIALLDGGESPEAADADASESKAEEKTGENRYMVVFTQYDESKDEALLKLMADKAEAAKKEAEKAAEPKVEADVKEGDEAAGEKEAVAEKAEAKRDFDKEIADRKMQGQQQAAALQQRFGKFFYVIADSSFKKLRPKQEELFVDPPKPEEKDPAKK